MSYRRAVNQYRMFLTHTICSKYAYLRISHFYNRLVCNSQTLLHLSLSGNPGINSDFLQLLFDVHRSSSSRVQYINLSACNIDSPISHDIFKILLNYSTDSVPLMELNLSFCSLSQTDRMRIAEAWKNGAVGIHEREAIVQDSICILGTTQQ